MTRLALYGIVWFTLRTLPSLALYPAQLPDSFFPDHPGIDGWTRWDGAHYVAIADVGYGPDNPSPGGGLGFFPLYPLAMRLLAWFTPLNNTHNGYAVAGLIIANLAFLAACLLLARIARQDGGDAVAETAVLLMCLFPFSFFFNAVYAESLFLALSLVSIILSRRGQHLGAAAVAGLAGATRLVGLALAPALLYGAWRAGVRGWRLLATGLLSICGTLSWFAWTAWKFDDPFAYFNAQEHWGGWDEHVRHYAELFFLHPRDAIGGDTGNMIILLNLTLGVVALLMLPLVWKTVDPALAVFTILLVVVQLAFTWVSLGRYLLPAAGLFVAGGVLLTREHWKGLPRDLILALFAIGLATLVVLFSHGFWVV